MWCRDLPLHERAEHHDLFARRRCLRLRQGAIAGRRASLDDLRLLQAVIADCDVFGRRRTS